MTIPEGSLYPTNYDNDDTLFLVHDSLRMTLADDYTPGDTSIVVSGESSVMSKFPSTGIITLTEQCNDPEYRGTAYYYNSRTDTTFDGLEILDGFTDVWKPKIHTHITQNVMSKHHNALKDACMSTEQFIGLSSDIDSTPMGDTIIGRLNYLRKQILTPKAWFQPNQTIGIIPFTVTFIDQSLKNPTSSLWDFGDDSNTDSNISSISNVSNISNISNISNSGSISLTPIINGPVPCGSLGGLTEEERTVTHTYFTPGVYDVTLTVGNAFGRDTITFPSVIQARAPVPDEAAISVSPSKARINQLITIATTDNGEQLDGEGNPIDPVIEYTWKLNDDLFHGNSSETLALYSVGGIYDVKLRVDTEFGSYRITKVDSAINITEQTNLWLMAFDSPQDTLSVSKNARTYEFGLLSESWKSGVMPELAVSRDYTFTSGYAEESYQRGLFLKNNGFAPKGSVSSGDGGNAVVYWAEDSNTIRFKQFNPFIETWTSAGLDVGETDTKNWNWTSFSDLSNIYLLFGLSAVEENPATTDLAVHKHNLSTGAFTSDAYTVDDFSNGAEDLMDLIDSYPATYKSCYKDGHGFIARNDAGPGTFFRIRSFYRTDGALNDYASTIIKLDDIPGTARTEFQMVSLTSGVFIFYNSGEVAAYNPTTNVWTTGGPGIGSSNFRALQDSTVIGFSNVSQPLLATSDSDRRAYLSFDYSPNTMVRFNESDLTFTSITSRPTVNEQFIFSVF